VPHVLCMVGRCSMWLVEAADVVPVPSRSGNRKKKKGTSQWQTKKKPSNDAPKLTACAPTPDYRPQMQKPREALALVHTRHARASVDRRRMSCVAMRGRGTPMRGV